MNLKSKSKSILALALAASMALPVTAFAAEDDANANDAGAETAAQDQNAEGSDSTATEDGKTATTEKKETKSTTPSKSYLVSLSLDHSMVGMVPGGHVLLTLKTEMPDDAKGILRWVSSDPRVATVTEDGRVYAKATGDCVVSAIVGNISVSCRVQVQHKTYNYDTTDSTATRMGYITDDEIAAELKQKEDGMAYLSDWNGTWNSVTTYFENKDVQTGFTALERKYKMTAGSLATGYAETFKADFSSVIIDGNTVTFYKEAQKVGEKITGKVVSKAEYKAVAAVDKGENGTAYKFETSDKDAAYKYLLIYGIEKDPTGKSMTHFNMLYSNDEADLEKTDWAPMMVAVNTDDSQIVAGITASVDASETAKAEAAKEAK